MSIKVALQNRATAEASQTDGVERDSIAMECWNIGTQGLMHGGNQKRTGSCFGAAVSSQRDLFVSFEAQARPAFLQMREVA